MLKQQRKCKNKWLADIRCLRWLHASNTNITVCVYTWRLNHKNRNLAPGWDIILHFAGKETVALWLWPINISGLFIEFEVWWKSLHKGLTRGDNKTTIRSPLTLLLDCVDGFGLKTLWVYAQTIINHNYPF